jgi:hypothetical protein
MANCTSKEYNRETIFKLLAASDSGGKSDQGAVFSKEDHCVLEGEGGGGHVRECVCAFLQLISISVFLQCALHFSIKLIVLRYVQVKYFKSFQNSSRTLLTTTNAPSEYP